MASVVQPILDFVNLGGTVVAMILVLSIFALALMAIKCVQFVSWRVGISRRSDQALMLWSNGEHDGASRLLEGNQNAVSRSLYVGMRELQRGNGFKEDIEELIQTQAVTDLHELQKGLRALEAIAQLAPLLGLFGTVLGMIEAFQKLQSAGNAVDPSILAGGIWVALLTTAAGLALAMPVSLVLTWFETRLEGERVAIQTKASILLNNSAKLLETYDAQTDAEFGELAYAN